MVSPESGEPLRRRDHADADHDDVGRQHLPPPSSTTSALRGTRSESPRAVFDGGLADTEHRDTGAQLDPVLAVQARAMRADHRTQDGAQRDVERLEDGDPAPEGGAGRGDLGPDEPGTDDHDPRRVDRRHGGPEGERVVERAQREEPVALAQLLGAGQPAGRAHRWR